jgi:hypothetical protein
VNLQIFHDEFCFNLSSHLQHDWGKWEIGMKERVDLYLLFMSHHSALSNKNKIPMLPNAFFVHSHWKNAPRLGG